MVMDLLSKIEKEMPGFSKGQKRIGRYIIEHYDKAAFMTASKLGDTVGVSESTVVRFATSWATTEEQLEQLWKILDTLDMPEP